MASGRRDIDGLFQLPLGDFTRERNALAARVAAAGRREEAARIKALPKPSVTAWAVNQLYWRHREAFDALLAAGGRVRNAQAAQLRGRSGELSEPLEARRAALSELIRRAARLLREANHSASPEAMRRVTTTLEALATYAGTPSSPAAGRLTSDVAAPGFEALTTLVPRTGGRAGRRGTSRVIPFSPPGDAKRIEPRSPRGGTRQSARERKARRAAAAAALRAAERALARTRTAAARAEAALRQAAARAKETEKVKDALAQRFEKATAEADEARRAAHHVAANAEEAAQAVADAERAVADARRTLAALTE